MNIWFIAALIILIIVVVCLIIFILVKRQKSKNTVPDSTAETYKSSSPQLNKNINSLMNYINQWISSIKTKQ